MQDNMTQDEIDAILKSAASASSAEANVVDLGSPSARNLGSPSARRTENVQSGQNPVDATSAEANQNHTPDVEAAHAWPTQESATEKQREVLNQQDETADLGSPSARNSECI